MFSSSFLLLKSFISFSLFLFVNLVNPFVLLNSFDEEDPIFNDIRSSYDNKLINVF